MYVTNMKYLFVILYFFSITPPNLTLENWPAPGEEKLVATSNRTYLESKELMEEKEDQENMPRTPASRTVTATGREHQSNSYSNNYSGHHAYGKEGAQRGYGSYSRDIGSRDNSGRRDNGGGTSQDWNNRSDRGGRRGGRGGGGYREGGNNKGGIINYGSSGSRAGGDGNTTYRNDGSNSSGYRGGRGNVVSSYKSDGSNSSNYRGDSSNSNNYKFGEGNMTGHRSDGGNYADFRGDGSNYRDNSSGYREPNRSSSNQYNAIRYDQFGNRQGNQNNYDRNQGGQSRGDETGGRSGNWNASRGGGGMRAAAAELSAKMEILQNLQQMQPRLPMFGQYSQPANHGRYKRLCSFPTQGIFW
nr:ATP-dependent RNA helicase bel-like [Cherax quadricarinatus]